MSVPEYDDKRNTIDLGDSPDVTIEMMSAQPVILEKLYGPAVFADLRVTPDVERGSWVIERRFDVNEPWTPWVEIPGQITAEF